MNNFAGVIKSITGGKKDAAVGDAVGVNNDKIIPVKVTGAVSYRDFLTLDDNGAFKKLTLSATPTTAEILAIVGRVMDAGTTGAGVCKALIWVRK